MEEVKEGRKSYRSELEVSTSALFGTAEAKHWLKLMKEHPDIRYYQSCVKASADSTTGTAYFDGAAQFIRIIEQIMDNHK